MERKYNILKEIIDQYIKDAAPVGSKSLDSTEFGELSSATIRNEMASLEKEGLLTHPHTSAGRIPTEKGYRFYIENFLTDKKLKKKDLDILQEVLKDIDDSNDGLKEIAKGVADISTNAIFVSFGPHDVYYTGISNLFRKPEFREVEILYDVSDVVDSLDDRLHELYEHLAEDFGVNVLIGSENPLSKYCSTIVSRFREQGLFGIVGPIRMDYAKNYNLANFISQELNK